MGCDVLGFLILDRKQNQEWKIVHSFNTMRDDPELESMQVYFGMTAIDLTRDGIQELVVEYSLMGNASCPSSYVTQYVSSQTKLETIRIE